MGRVRGVTVWSLPWLCAGLFVLVVTSLPAGAVEYGDIGGRPAYPQASNPRSKSIFIHTIAPGATASDGVQVVNYTNTAKTLLVYPTDSILSSGGAFACAQKVDPRKAVGGWIHLAAAQVTLGPQSSQIVPFTITAPKNADVGENDGCIVIQEQNGPTQTVQQSGGSILLNFRTAIRVAVLIPGKIVKHLSIVGYSAVKGSDGDFILRPAVKNDGNVSLDTTVTTATRHLLGGSFTTPPQQFPILRGSTASWNIRYKSPAWGGLLTSHFSVTYDANPDDTLGSTVQQQLKTLTSHTIVFFAPPKPVPGAAELVVLVGFLGGLYRLTMRSRSRRWQAANWSYHLVGPQENINTIADRYGVGWKSLAKANGLKAPYALRPGQKLKIVRPRK